MEISVDRMFRDVGHVSATFTLSDVRSIGRTRGGDLHPTSYGTPLWFGSFTVRPHRHVEMEKIEARMETLLQTDGTFLLCAPSRGAATIEAGTVSFINATDRRIIRITGPVQREGDMIGVVYDGSRRGLHRVALWDGTNTVLTSPLSSSVSVGAALTYGRPTLRAIADSNGYGAPSYNPALADGLSLAWTQTLARAT